LVKLVGSTVRTAPSNDASPPQRGVRGANRSGDRGPTPRLAADDDLVRDPLQGVRFPADGRRLACV
jgi:hypothetical protein